MSTSIPLTAGAMQPVRESSYSSSTSSMDRADQDEPAPDGGFSAVFAEATQAAPSPAVTDPALTNPAIVPNTTIPELSTALAAANNGNSLPGSTPVVAWSGIVALGDEQGAAAMRMAGDANQSLLGKPAFAADINTALQLADQPTVMKNMNSATKFAGQDPATKSLIPINTSANWENLLPAQLQLSMAQRNTALANNADGKPILSAVEGAGFSVLTQDPTLVQTGTPLLTPYLSNARPENAALTMSLPITHPDWSNNLGESIKWLVQQHTQQADMRLNPPELGLLDVRIQLNNDQTSITFSSPHAQVRDAVEAALPQLRQLFSDSGMLLANVDVGHQQRPQQHAQQEPSASTQQEAEGNDADTVSLSMGRAGGTLMGSGMLDVYA
jgi:flagellar hook-length control protein FliK